MSLGKASRIGVGVVRDEDGARIIIRLGVVAHAREKMRRILCARAYANRPIIPTDGDENRAPPNDFVGQSGRDSRVSSPVSYRFRNDNNEAAGDRRTMGPSADNVKKK